MKKLILLAFVSAFVFNSCRKDDDNKPTFVGTWKVDKYVTVFGNGGSQTFTPNSCEAKNSITFTNDGKIISVEYGNNYTGECVSNTINGTYFYNEQNKTIAMYGDEVNTYEIASITDAELVFINKPSYDYDGDGKVDQDYIYYKK